MNQSQEVEMELPTIYPTSDPNIVGILMNDPVIKTYTGKHICFTQPYMSEETLAILTQHGSKNKASSDSSSCFRGFAKKGHVADTAVPSPKRKGIIGYSDETLVSADPDPILRYVHPPRQFAAASALPPDMSLTEVVARAAARKATLEAATAKILAEEEEAAAAIPPIRRYWEDPSKKKASEAATSTEGQAEAG